MFDHRDLFHTSIGFDLRAPEQFGVTSQQVFNEAMAMVEFADKSGIDEGHTDAATGKLDAQRIEKAGHRVLARRVSASERNAGAAGQAQDADDAPA